MAQARHTEVDGATPAPVAGDTSRPSARWWMQVAAVAALAAALRGALLAAVLADGDIGLYVDEAQYWDWSRELAWGYYSKPPVIAALIAASTSLFGDDAAGVKALAMLCWPAAALVLARLAFAIAGHVGADAAGAGRAGLWAAVVFLVSTPAGVLGLAATTDAPLLLAWSLAAAALWRASRDAGVGAWLWVGVATALALLSKYTAGALVPAAVAAAVVPVAGTRAAPLRERLTGPLLAGVVASVLLAPHLAWNAAHG
ncbi:MAG: glycosyltransferase family 39 protein, partial [Gammaproteobacteria bacterium]